MQIRAAHRHNAPDKNDQRQLQTAKQLPKFQLQRAKGKLIRKQVSRALG
jgi:hypothetical protein